ncbi:hypothetical protein CQA69_02170 [Campylobacter estrildidarum]|uniref:Urease accessory protein UreH-like transmembrane domain-containing protein n=2 Tax=Campylobacter estrildidarum TaxID=2510189 RepID=A0A4U7BRQ8_9BACT|nr:hypothetical protein CQA69_02170 [Campylobacter estrildidarum]
MCGGFNLVFMKLNSTHKNLFLLTFLYQLSRIFAYVVLGICCGIFGNILAINAKIQSFSFFLFGIFMIILGCALIFRGNLLAFIENHIFLDSLLQKLIKKSMNFRGIKSAFILGFINGFVPCGLVYFYLIDSMKRENILESICIMLIFGFSTLPAMLFFTKISQFLSEVFKKIFNYIAYIIIIAYGLKLAYTGFISFVNY